MNPSPETLTSITCLANAISCEEQAKTMLRIGDKAAAKAFFSLMVSWLEDAAELERKEQQSKASE